MAPYQRKVGGCQTVQEQILAGHLEESFSPWNPIITIKKKLGKWKLLQDLWQVNKRMIVMGSLPYPGSRPLGMECSYETRGPDTLLQWEQCYSQFAFSYNFTKNFGIYGFPEPQRGENVFGMSHLCGPCACTSFRPFYFLFPSNMTWYNCSTEYSINLSNLEGSRSNNDDCPAKINPVVPKYLKSVAFSASGVCVRAPFVLLLWANNSRLPNCSQEYCFLGQCWFPAQDNLTSMAILRIPVQVWIPLNTSNHFSTVVWAQISPPSRTKRVAGAVVAGIIAGIIALVSAITSAVALTGTLQNAATINDLQNTTTTAL